VAAWKTVAIQVATLAKDSVQNTDQEVIVGHQVQTRR